MKKLFTFFACAFVALSANAKLDLSLEQLTNGWGSSYDPATKTISYTAGDWGGRGWNLETLENLTDYQYFVVELAEPSSIAKLKLCVEYADELNAGEGNGNSSDGNGKTMENPNTFFGIELDSGESFAKQAYIQSQAMNSGTAVLKAAYLCTKNEYEEALAEYRKKELKRDLSIGKAVDGVLTMAAGESGWYDTGWLATNVSDYKCLIFNLGAVSGKCKVEIQGSQSAKIDINPSEEPQLIIWELPEGFTLLNQFAFQNLNNEGSDEADTKKTVVNINSIYLTSLTKEQVVTGISNPVAISPVANPDAPIYNLAGQKVSKAYKGVVIQNGKKFVLK